MTNQPPLKQPLLWSSISLFSNFKWGIELLIVMYMGKWQGSAAQNAWVGAVLLQKCLCPVSGFLLVDTTPQRSDATFMDLTDRFATPVKNSSNSPAKQRKYIIVAVHLRNHQ